MRLFRKKKSENKVQNETFQNPITGNFITIEGKKIKPIFNKKVGDEFAQTIINFPKSKKVETKYMCLLHSDIAVYLALKEGANQLNIKFDYTQTELFRLIDFQDYLNILLEIQKNIGYVPENSILNN